MDKPESHSSEQLAELPRVDAAGLTFHAGSPNQCAELVLSAAFTSPRHFHLANAYTCALALRDEGYRAVLADDATVVFADGKPISWVSWLRRDRFRIRQVRGPQLFLDALLGGVDRGVRHYLLGASEATLAALQENLRRTIPGLIIAGADSPPFRPPTGEELRDRDERIRASGADVVWVGLGTPKQDLEVLRITRDVGLTAVAVGAAFDFAAGTLPVAPSWMRATGLEWLFRFACEPKRLWRRYLIGNTLFLYAAARDLGNALRRRDSSL